MDAIFSDQPWLTGARSMWCKALMKHSWIKDPYVSGTAAKYNRNTFQPAVFLCQAFILKQKYSYSSKSIHTQAKVFILKQKYSYSSKSIHIQAKVFIFKQKYSYSSKNIHIQAQKYSICRWNTFSRIKT